MSDDLDAQLEQIRSEEVKHKRIQMGKVDFCPACYNQASDGAIQPQVPVPGPEEGQILPVGLPFLVCLKCCNVYMPRSFLTQMMGDVEEEENVIEVVKPTIITPN